MTITQLAANSSVETDLTGMTVFAGSGTGFYWRDTSSYHTTSGTALASLRVNNASSASNGIIWQTVSLVAGTYSCAVWAQILASTTNTAFVVRVSGGTSPLIEYHWTGANNNWTRTNGDGSTGGKQAGVGFFSLSATTTVEIIVGVGIYGSASAGSARFDELYFERVGAAGIATSSLVVNDYFDGNTPNTTAFTYAWTGTAELSTSTATPIIGGTYQSFSLVYQSHFDIDTILNTSDWYAQDGYAGTNGNGTRVGSLAVISGGNLELRTNANNLGGVNSQHQITYGRVDVVCKKDPRAGYSPVHFLWSVRDVWADGELDIHEGNSNTQITSFMHNAVGNPSAQIGPHITTIDTTVFHKESIIWLPNKVQYLIDDVVIWENTDTTYIPTNAMKLIFQTEVGIPGGTGTAAQTPRVNYPAALSPYWAFTIKSVAIYQASTATNHVVTGQALEILPNNGPGSPSVPVDTATAVKKVVAVGVEITAIDPDRATGYVPGQADNTSPGPTPVVTLRGCPRWLLRHPDDGTLLELTDFVNDVEVVRGWTGWMAPKAKIVRDVIPGQPGALTRSIRHDVRTLQLPLVATRHDISALEATLGQLVNFADPVRGPLELQRVSSIGKTSTLSVEAVNGLDGGPRGVDGTLVEAFTVTFEAPDPYWYGDVVNASWDGSSGAAWYPGIPWTMGSSTVIGDVQLPVASDVLTWPVWTIVGPGSNPQMTNVDTGEHVALTATLAAGDVVTIDTRPGAKLVTGPDGSNWFARLTAYDLFALRPGINHITLSFAGTTRASYIGLAYRPASKLPA